MGVAVDQRDLRETVEHCLNDMEGSTLRTSVVDRRTSAGTTVAQPGRWRQARGLLSGDRRGPARAGFRVESDYAIDASLGRESEADAPGAIRPISRKRGALAFTEILRTASVVEAIGARVSVATSHMRKLT